MVQGKSEKVNYKVIPSIFHANIFLTIPAAYPSGVSRFLSSTDFRYPYMAKDPMNFPCSLFAFWWLFTFWEISRQ